MASVRRIETQVAFSSSTLIWKNSKSQGLRAQLAFSFLPYAFDATHNKTACRKISLWYTRHGGDLGEGVKYLREACGLKSLGGPDVASGGNATSKAADLGLIQYPEGAADEDNLSKISLFVAKEMNHKGVVILTTSMWGQLSLKGCHTSGLSKPAIWESFIASSFWTDFGAFAKSPH